MSQKVTCPHCKKEFPLEEGLKPHLESYENKIRAKEKKETDKIIQAKNKEITNARAEGEKFATNKLEEKYKKALEKKDNQMQDAIDRGLKKAEADLENKVKNKYKLEYCILE